MRMRCTLQEREIGFTVQLSVHGHWSEVIVQRLFVRSHQPGWRIAEACTSNISKPDDA